VPYQEEVQGPSALAGKYEKRGPLPEGARATVLPMRVPTDLEILDAIYDRYYQTFTAWRKDSPSNERNTKTYVPIDIAAVAKRLGVDGDIVFGRLYYHFQEKHGIKREDDGSTVPFFKLELSGERHCVNFPLLSSVLAELQRDARKDRWAVGIALLALAISIVGLFL